METAIYRILNLLNKAEHDIESLKLKLNISSKHVKALLDWGEANKLWIRDPASEFYIIADTGKLLLDNPEHIEELIKARSIELAEVEDIIPLLKDDRLLCRIREVMDKEVVGEYENKLLLFLIFLSKDLGADYAQACFIMGESSSGKSYLMHKVLSYFPEECVIWLTRSTTHGLEYFCKGKDLSGHILAIEEAPGISDAQPYVRPIFSERGLRIITAQALGGGNVVSQVIEVKGCPAFVTTSCSPLIDDQMSTRIWILSTDESVEQTKRILEFEAYKEKYPKPAGIEEEKEAIRDSLKELKPVKVLIPYADFIDFPYSKIRVRRDFPKLLALIKVSAYLHQYQRPRLVLNGEEYVIATFADYNIAYTLARNVLRPTILGLPEGVLRVYDICKKLSEQAVEITSRSVTESCEYSQKTVQKYLNQLVRARLLLRDESQRENRYSLIEEKDSRLGLNLLLIDRFGEKELEKWLSTIVDKERFSVSLEEMRANLYNPLPTINNSTMYEEAEECSSTPEKARDSRLYQDLRSKRDLAEDVLKGLAKLSGGLVPIQDAVKELEAEGFEDAEGLIKKLLREGRIYEPRKGFLSVLGDSYG